MTIPVAETDVESLIAGQRNWLLALARSMTKTNVDDLVQEGHISMWKALGTFDPAKTKGTLTSWLRLNARYHMVGIVTGKAKWTTAVYHYRSRRDVLEIPAEYIGDIYDSLSGQGYDSPEISYHREEILAAIKTLTPAAQKYIFRRFWRQDDGFELNEEWDETGRTRQHWYRAKQKLRKDLAHLETAA